MALEVNTHGFYLLRNPLLPLSGLLAFNEALKRHGNDKTFFAEALRREFSAPVLQEALYIASPELYQEFTKWLSPENPASSGDPESLLLTLYKYYVRMCSRCTPYGLFAGCSLGAWKDQASAIAFNPERKYRKHSRLDMNYVAEMAKHVCERPEVKQQLKFYPNTSLYQVGDKYRYVEFRTKNKFRSYHLSSLDASPHLSAILKRAAAGASLAELAATLVSDEITAGEAGQFVEKAVEMQILVSELEPTVTGEEFYKAFVKKVSALQHTGPVVEVLRDIQAQLDVQSDDPGKYFTISKKINEHFTKTGKKDLIQTDLFFDTPQNQLSGSVAGHLLDEIKDLFVLSQENVNSNLEAFRRSFYERYEEQEIPLQLALDAELGIGYASVVSGQADNLPLVENLHLPEPARAAPLNWDKADKFKLERYKEALREHKTVIQLRDEDLKAMGQPAADIKMPDSFYLFGTLLAGSAAELDKGDFKFELTSCSGPSGVNLLGRFCHGNRELAREVAACIAVEEAHKPDAIFAEVVHLPEARVGNILMRPKLRKYEIPYLGASALDADGVIPMDDLMVSVPRGGRIVLRSKKYGKEVIPRLTSAHNYARGLNIYRFLCDLQGYRLHTTVRWDWGPLAEQGFLPRVEYKHYILSRARWRITTDDDPALAGKEPAADSAFARLREARNIPAQVVLTEGDNELLLDLDTAFGRKILLEKLKKAGRIVLLESLATAGNCFVQDGAGCYSNEIVIPVHKPLPQQPVERPRAVSRPAAVKRTFFPGSEWLYVKIYTGTKTADRVLTDYVKPLTTDLLREESIDKWFFVRYRDPDEHLRIRLHNGTEPGFYGAILGKIHALFEPLLEKGTVRKIQVDTYQREIERYSSPAMALTESLFFEDSRAVVHFLDLLDGDAGEKYRWLFALRGIDCLLDDFGYDTPGKLALITNMRDNFFREFKGGKGLNVQLNDRYRAAAKDIALFLDPAHDEANEIEEAVAVFADRSRGTVPIAAEIRDLQRFSPGAPALGEIVPSYIHMFMNRLLIAKHRLHELVIYHYLSKYYESKLARQKGPRKLVATEAF